MGIANLADDDFIADAGPGQFLDVSQTKGLALFDPLPRGRCLGLEAGSLLLIDGITDDRPGRCPDCGANQRADPWVVRRCAANDRTRAGANRAAFQCARRGIVRAPLWRVTSCQHNPARQECNNHGT